MAKSVFDHERVIDREPERARFREILSTTAVPRLITVQDESGNGKSVLLQLLAHLAMEVDPPAAVCRCIIEESSQPMWLANEIKRELGLCGVHLPGFKQLNEARLTYQHHVFGFRAPPIPTVQLIVHESTLSNSPVTGAHIDAPTQWPDSYEDIAQERCLDALLDDLRDLSRVRSVILLFDQFERAEVVRTWLASALINRVFSQAESFGALIVVVASKEPVLSTVVQQLGSRRDKFVERFELSPWGEDDIRQWLVAGGAPQPDVFITAVAALLKQGRSLKDLEMISALFAPPQGSASA